jgi:hypothetical protein
MSKTAYLAASHPACYLLATKQRHPPPPSLHSSAICLTPSYSDGHQQVPVNDLGSGVLSQLCSISEGDSFGILISLLDLFDDDIKGQSGVQLAPLTDHRGRRVFSILLEHLKNKFSVEQERGGV